MPTRDELIRYYGELTDDQLMRIGLYEADELTQEALEVLKAEIRTRGLGKDMEEAIEVQTCLLSPGDQEELVACFRQLPCPICGATGGSLNAGTVATARSFIIMTTREERLVVGCPKCIVAAAHRATNLTCALGWWGLPWGPIRTFQAISKNARTNSTVQGHQATEELRQYVAANRGAVALRLQQNRGGPDAQS